MPSLSFTDVSFRYGRRQVFSELTHSFSSSATVLLGPNGAGKSTLLGLAASVLRPARGEVTIDHTLARRGSLSEYRRKVAWMPQEIRAIPGLSVREQVAYIGWLKGMSSRAASHEAAGALRLVGLETLADRRPAELSGGERRRVGLAQTLIHGAEFVLMDEPTAGLDPAQRLEFQALVAGLRGRASVVISTHQTDDIGLTYDTVVVLNEGQVRFAGPVAGFLELGTSQAPHERVVEAYRHALLVRGA